MKYPLIQMTHPGAPYGNYVDRNLIRMGYDARVSVSVPHALIPLISLPDTDFLTLTIRHIYENLGKQFDLKSANAPFEIGPYVCRQYWHQQDTNDPAHQWLRRVFKQVADEA